LVKIEGGDINEMKEHVEKNFTLVYLNQSNYLSGELSQLYKNYLPSFLLLYQQYKATGNEAGGAAIKTLILKIAGQAGITEEVLKQLNR
jgi:plasmid replication initiation protein